MSAPQFNTHTVACATCRTLAHELADALDECADLRRRNAGMAEALAAWNSAAALALRRDAERLERAVPQ